MENYQVWDFTDDKVLGDAITAANTMALTENQAVGSNGIKESKYLIDQAWGYYPFMDKLFLKAELIIGRPINGVVADIGSGTGVVASWLSKLRGVTQVYAIEYAEEYVKTLMPVTFKSFEAQADKIKRVVGSFNKIKVADNFFDFILELNSLHHSENLDVTLAELNRVLKPGGYVIAADRGHNNKVTDQYLKKIVEAQLSDEQKKIYGLPQHFTRAMYGEHEYRYRDWKNHFIKNGFEVKAFSFPWSNPKYINILAKIFFSIFGNLFLRLKIDFIPYYRWFYPYFKGPNMLLVARKIK